MWKNLEETCTRTLCFFAQMPLRNTKTLNVSAIVSIIIYYSLHILFVFNKIHAQPIIPGEDYTSYSLHNVHMKYNWVMALTKHPRVLEAITAVLGPDVLLLDSRFICKYPVSKQSKTQGSNGITSQNQENESQKKESDQESEPSFPYVAWHQDMK